MPLPQQDINENTRIGVNLVPNGAGESPAFALTLAAAPA
jgi:hypothetical protein